MSICLNHQGTEKKKSGLNQLYNFRKMQHVLYFTKSGSCPIPEVSIQEDIFYSSLNADLRKMRINFNQE